MSTRPLIPAVPPACGGHVGPIAQPKAATTRPHTPAVPPACGGHVGPVAQPKAATTRPHTPAVPPPAGGHVAGTGRSAQPKMAPGAVIQRGGSQSSMGGKKGGGGGGKKPSKNTGADRIGDWIVAEEVNFEAVSNQPAAAAPAAAAAAAAPQARQLVRLYDAVAIGEDEEGAGQKRAFNYFVGKLLETQRGLGGAQAPLSQAEERAATEWIKGQMSAGGGEYGPACKAGVAEVVADANRLGYSINNESVRRDLLSIVPEKVGMGYTTTIGGFTHGKWAGGGF